MPASSRTCPACQSPVHSDRRRSRYCSPACWQDSRRAKARARQAKNGAARNRKRTALRALAPWLDFGLVSPEEAEVWAALSAATRRRVRTPKEQAAAARERMRCLHCGASTHTAALSRPRLYCSRDCYLASRAHDLATDTTGAAYARYYTPRVEAPDAVDLAFACRGLIDYEEPCPHPVKVGLASPLGMCPRCAAETFAGRLDDAEAAGDTNPERVAEARRAIAELAALSPTEAASFVVSPSPSRGRPAGSVNRFPSVPLLPGGENGLEHVAGWRRSARADSGDYWAVWRDSALGMCRTWARACLADQPPLRAFEGAMVSLHLRLAGLRAPAGFEGAVWRPAEGVMDELAALLRALRSRLVSAKGAEWTGDLPPIPLRDGCAFCGFPVEHRPLAAWSFLCPRHVDDAEAHAAILPLREREAREAHRVSALRESVREMAAEWREELRPEAVAAREREAQARSDWAEDARRFFARLRQG